MSASDRHINVFSQSERACLWRVLRKTNERQTSGLLACSSESLVSESSGSTVTETDFSLLKSFSLNECKYVQNSSVTAKLIVYQYGPFGKVC